jgi:ABC-type transport system involved in multi-copper enzyme maturation permease subunit
MTAVGEAITGSGAARWRERLRRMALGYAFNPLLVRDLRSLTRGRRPLALQMGYLLVAMIAMAIAALICHQERAMAAQHGYFAQWNYGQTMFTAMFETQAVLICLVVIGYSAGAIALEQEKRTFEMLSVTALSTLEIVLGKVAAITALCALLLVTTLPLAAICLVLGGVSSGEVLRAYGLLLYNVPMWAAGCVLLSILVGRTVGAYVSAMICMTIFLFGASAGMMYGMGAISPFFVPYVEEAVVPFDVDVLVWVSPLVVYALLGLLSVVVGAEAMPLHRPRRSTALRLLLLGSIFVLTLLLYGAGLEDSLRYYARGGVPLRGSYTRSPTSQVLAGGLPGGLMLGWLVGCLAAPILTSYRPPKEAYQRPLTWLLGPVSVRRWLRREANVGWRSALLMFGAYVVAMLLPYGIAQATGRAGGVIFTGYTIGMLLFATMLYAVAIFGYSCWGAAFALAWQDRKIAGLFTVVVILALNTLALFGECSPMAFRKVQFLLHPLLLMTSPLPAAYRALGEGAYGHYWNYEWRSPIYLFVLSVLYQVAMVTGALWYLRRVGTRDQGPGAGEERAGG